MKYRLLVLNLLLSLGIIAQTTDSSYREEEIVLDTKSGQIFGTITLPVHANKIPVVLIIAGSGPTDRNGNNAMMKNNALQMIAYGLAAHEIASVRFDKRGIGASSKSVDSEQGLRFENYISDASDWIALLKKDKRFSRVIVLGHSEGSLIGMLTEVKPDRFISIAGVGTSASVLLKKQLSAQPEKIKNTSYSIIDSLSEGKMVDSVPPYLGSLFRPSVQPYLISWFKYDPAVSLRALHIPVLIIQGKTDIQVDSTDAQTLAAANPKAKLVLIDSMNHILKFSVIDRSQNLKTYFDPSLPLADKLIPVITEFIHSKR